MYYTSSTSWDCGSFILCCTVSSLYATFTVFPLLVCRTSVGVFFCGPPVLSHNLHRHCNDYTERGDANSTKFYYNKENF